MGKTLEGLLAVCCVADVADVVRPVNTTIPKELEPASVVLKGFFAFQKKLSLHRIVELDF